MKLRRRNPCSDCPNQGCGRHSSCEAYMKFYRENRERNAARLEEARMNEYTKDSIFQTKAGTRSTMSRYRSKGR